jgi:predicted Zn-dependent protease
LPDGTIVIALALLVTFQNEAQLAFVLAHELAHVTRRHSILSLRYDAMTSSHVERMRLSRQLEAEADRDAVRLMSTAGYDPREAVSALTHVVESSPDATHTIRAWNSHDYLPNRLAEIRWAIAVQKKREGDRRAEPFQRAMDTCRLQGAALELEADRFDEALAIVTHHLERMPEAGQAYALRAQITSRRDPGARLSDAVGADLERAVEHGPNDPDSLRALGLFLRDTGDAKRSSEMLWRYLEARPDAFDRKLIERYLDPAPSVQRSRTVPFGINRRPARSLPGA